MYLFYYRWYITSSHRQDPYTISTPGYNYDFGTEIKLSKPYHSKLSNPYYILTSWVKGRHFE